MLIINVLNILMFCLLTFTEHLFYLLTSNQRTKISILRQYLYLWRLSKYTLRDQKLISLFFLIHIFIVFMQFKKIFIQLTSLNKLKRSFAGIILIVVQIIDLYINSQFYCDHFMSSNKSSSQSKNSQYFLYDNLNQQILSNEKQSFNQACKPSQLFDKVQLLKSKTDETQLQPLQGLHSLKKLIKRNKKVTKQKLLSQQMKPWLDQQPTIPFSFEDQLSSISCRNQDNTPEDSLISFFRRNQSQYQQQCERFSQISSYPPIPKYQQFQQKNQQYDNSSQMDQEEFSQQSEPKQLQIPLNILQNSRQFNLKQKYLIKQSNQVNRQSTQKQTQKTSPVCFVLPRPNRYIHNFYKNKQLIVLPEYESKIQDNSILAVKGIEFSVKLRSQQKVRYPQFLPQLYRSQMEDTLRRQALKNLTKTNQLKNEHNQKLQDKSSQNQSQTDQNEN